MKKLLCILIILGLGGLVLYSFRGNLPAASFLETEEDSSIRASGTIEIQEVDIAPKTAGYISVLAIDEGDKVEKGQLLAEIDRPDLRATLERDRAAMKKAKAVLDNLRKGARREEIAEVDANIEAASVKAVQAERDYARYLSLYKDDAVSARQMEEYRLARNVAGEDLKALREKRNLLLKGAREDEIRAQEEQLNILKADMKLTMTRMDDTRIKSPVSGKVLMKNVERGEFAPIGSVILTLGDETDCWIDIYIPSTYLGRIFQGQEASVHVDSYPRTSFKGRITEIAERAEYTPRASITPEERANMVFKIKISVDNTKGLFKPGMPADVVIDKKDLR